MGLEKVCRNCKYNLDGFTCDIKDKEMHCFKCKGMRYFLSKESEYPKIKCSDCRYYNNSVTKEPCSRCEDYSKFNAKPPRLRKTANIPVIDVERFGSSGVVIIDDVESAPSEKETDSTKDSIETAINNFHTSVSPCRMCKYESDESTCKTCCYFYASEFVLKEIK